jgi:F0F1-type ATP synthase membrane subunit b/b'
MILASPRIPLTGKTLVDEEQLLDQLDLVRLNLPSAFQKAQDIIHQKEAILAEAEDYAQQIAAMAEQRAAQIMDELGIVRQAEREAQQIRQQLQEECKTLQQQTLQDIEQKRRQARQEVEEMRQQAMSEQREIQQEADEYADGVLGDVERRLSDMLRVIRNGRQQLGIDMPRNLGGEPAPDLSPKAGKPDQRKNRDPKGKNPNKGSRG